MNILTDKEIVTALRLPFESFRRQQAMQDARAIESAVLSKLAEQAGEPFGSERYRVEKRQSGFWPYCVVAGTGTMEIFIGHQKQCTKVANALATAFEDGKFAAQQRTAEACAKAVERLIGGDGLCADDGVWIHDCAEAIRNGYWREYL